ncbi:MAG: TolC family protein [Bdellovibrionota bacterium]
MRSFVIIQIFLLSFVLEENKAFGAPASLNLREVYSAAKEKTESVPQGKALIRESEALKDQVYGRFLPGLALGATYLRQNKITGSNSQDQTASKITLTQSLYAGGKDKADFSAASSEVAARQQNLEAVENALFADVAASFFAVLAAEQDIKNIQKSIALTQDRIKELRKRMKIGKTQKVEVLAAEALDSVLESQLLAAQGVHNVARDTFARVTGLDRTTLLTDPMRFPKEPKTIESYLNEIDNRPDIRALKLGVETNEHEIRSAQAGHLPTLSLIGNGYLSQSGVQSSNNPDWDIGLSLSFPIFSGGIVSAKVRQIREIEIQAELLLKNRRRVAEEEIRRAYSTLMSDLEQVKSLEKALSATEQNYKEQARNYSFSLTTNLDVIQALNALQDTKRTLDKTRFDALTAWAQLRSATAQPLK